MDYTSTTYAVVDHPPTIDPVWVEHEAHKRVPPEKRKFDQVSLKFGDLRSKFPEKRREIVRGLMREGEVLNIIASPKVGKSWLAHGLAIAASQGISWLDHEIERPMRVLILDNELHPEELSNRLEIIAEASKADRRLLEENLTVLPVRGKGYSLGDVGALLADVKPGSFDIIILDALYRFIPQGTSENDNAGMTAVYNHIDRLADFQRCCFIVIHHTSKGDQGGKAVTDVGAGAGSIARAVDGHLTIRPHEEEGLSVLEGTLRSFPRPNPKSIAWNFPLWEASGVEPVLMDARKANQKRKDDTSGHQVLELLTEEWVTCRSIRTRLGWRSDKLKRIVQSLEDDGEVDTAAFEAESGGGVAQHIRKKPMPF